MDGMTAFERQVAGELGRMAGPGRRIDAVALVSTVTTAPAATSVTTRIQSRLSLAPTQRGSTMFFSLKLVAAGAIVALFVGLVLTGVLTVPKVYDVAPGAVTGSPSPSASDSLLPGVELTVEETEPGVYRVLSDGVRALPGRNMIGIALGQDGAVWILQGQRFLRLGEPGTHPWAAKRPVDVTDFEVARDGTIWTVDRPSDGAAWLIRSYDGESWTTHHATDGVFYRDSHLEIGPDERVWTMWMPDDGGPKVVGYFDGVTWQSIGQADAVSLALSGRDEVWASGLGGVWSLHRYVDGAWESMISGVGDMDASADGTLWGIDGDGLVRFDGSDRTHWSWYTLPFEIEGGMGRMGGPLVVAPDGSAWIGSRVAVPPTPGDSGDAACDGVRRFDGTSTQHFLPGLCVTELETSGDGSVWVLAGGSDPDLYVITPAAVAATG